MKTFFTYLLTVSVTFSISLAQDSAYYQFSEADYSTSGVADQFPSGNDIPSGGVTGAVRALDDNNGTNVFAASFDGVDDRMLVTGLTFNSNLLTVMAWVKLNTDTTASIQRIVTGMPGGTFFFRLTATGNFQASKPTVTTTETIENEEWTHLAYTSDADSAKLYINGTKVKAALLTTAFDFASTTNLEIGAGGETPNGLIDEVKVLNRVASEAEIIAAATPANITAILGSTDFLDVDYLVYPNPSNGENVSLDFPANLNIETVELLDYSGTTVYSTSNTNEVNTSGLSAGLYFVRATTTDNKVLNPKKVLISK